MTTAMPVAASCSRKAKPGDTVSSSTPASASACLQVVEADARRLPVRERTPLRMSCRARAWPAAQGQHRRARPQSASCRRSSNGSCSAGRSARPGARRCRRARCGSRRRRRVARAGAGRLRAAGGLQQRARRRAVLFDDGKIGGTIRVGVERAHCASRSPARSAAAREAARREGHQPARHRLAAARADRQGPRRPGLRRAACATWWRCRSCSAARTSKR